MLLPAGTPVVRVSADWATQAVVARTVAAVSSFASPGGSATVHARLAPALRRLQQIAAGSRIATVTVSLRGRSFTVAATTSASLPGPGLMTG